MPLEQPPASAGAPITVDYLVGTADGTLSNEIVVGTTPGGELGGTWASPTVDATHSGSTHSAATDTHIADTTDVHAHTSLSAIGIDDHHARDHTVTGSTHTASGLTIGHVLTATSSTAFAFQAPSGGGLTSAEAFCTATTALSAATYADITGASVSLAAGTWLILATIVASHVTTTAGILHGAITDGANAIVAEGSQSFDIATASVAQNATLSLSAIVSPDATTTYKLRGARGTTTYTSTVTVMDGSGVNTANNTTNGSDKGTSIRAIKIA